MKQEIINLIDKVIGKKGIMRSPAWWVNRIFCKILQYTDDTVRYAESRANSKINAKENKIHTVYAAGLTADSLKTWMKQRNAFFYRDIVAGKTLTCNVCVDYGKSLSERYIPCSVSIGQNMIICAIDTDMILHFDETIINPKYYSAWFAIHEDGDADANISTADLVVPSRLKTINKQSLIGSGDIEIGGEVVDNLDSDNPDAALSAKQGKVLKEMMLRVRTIHSVTDGIEYTPEQQEYNAETYRIMNSGEYIAWAFNGTIHIPTVSGYSSVGGNYYGLEEFGLSTNTDNTAEIQVLRIELYSDGKISAWLKETTALPLQ